MTKRYGPKDKKGGKRIFPVITGALKNILTAAVAGLMVLFLLWMYAIAPRTDERFQLSDLTKYDYAHRGLHNNEDGVVENTLRSFHVAVESGYGVELDVQLTRDGQVVVFHDKSLSRLCGDRRQLQELTLNELGTITLLHTEQTIPTFEEALQAVGERVPIIIEVKGYNDSEVICPLVWEILKDYEGLYCIQSFSQQVLQWFKENQPQVMRGQLKNAQEIGCTSEFEFFVRQNLCANFLTRPDFTAYDCRFRETPAMWMVKRLFHMPEFSWTVRDEETYHKLKDENCIIIFEGFLPDGGTSEENRTATAVGSYPVTATE